jgi:hypothetical protein
VHDALPLFDGLTCRLAQLDAASANVHLRRNQAALLRRIRRLIARAPGESPRKAMKDLLKASHGIDRPVALLKADQILGPSLGDVIQRLTELRRSDRLGADRAQSGHPSPGWNDQDRGRGQELKGCRK